MRVLISGASGLIGTELKRQLIELGHEPLSLVRNRVAGSGEVAWNPDLLEIEPEIMNNIDAVVNLAGATTGRIPWTKKYKQEIVNSRINSTRTLVSAINSASTKPRVLISGSASGFYGDCGDTILNEESPKGSGFLSDLASDWEQEARLANTRVVLVRTTMVMSKRLGALGRLLPLIRAGIGGALGSGRQWWAWISVEDEAAAIIHLINTQDAEGPFNLTAPEPATCGQIVTALAKELKRPALFRVPSWALNLLIGEAARELLLCSQNMTAKKLLSTGYRFRHPDLKMAAKWVLEK